VLGRRRLAQAERGGAGDECGDQRVERIVAGAAQPPGGGAQVEPAVRAALQLAQ
jgi:hypothetical protein